MITARSSALRITPPGERQRARGLPRLRHGRRQRRGRRRLRRRREPKQPTRLATSASMRLAQHPIRVSLTGPGVLDAVESIRRDNTCVGGAMAATKAAPNFDAEV